MGKVSALPDHTIVGALVGLRLRVYDAYTRLLFRSPTDQTVANRLVHTK